MILRTRAQVGYKPPRAGMQVAGNTNEVIVHWVGAPNMPAAPSEAQSTATLRNIQRAEMEKDYRDISYGYAVDPSGIAYEARTDQYQDGASNQENSHSVSIVYMGGPGTPLTAAGKQTITELVQWLKGRKPGIARVVGHRDIRPEPTQCPGDELALFVRTIPLIPATPVGDDDDMQQQEFVNAMESQGYGPAVRDANVKLADTNKKLDKVIDLLNQLVAK